MCFCLTIVTLKIHSFQNFDHNTFEDNEVLTGNQRLYFRCLPAIRRTISIKLVFQMIYVKSMCSVGRNISMLENNVDHNNSLSCASK